MAGGTATFTVVLDSQPTANVSIGVSSSDLSEGRVSMGTLTFTNTDWSNAKTVTVTGVDDNVDDGNQMYMIELAPAVSTDPKYSGVDPVDVSVSNTDDDVAPTSITLTVDTNSLSEGDNATDVEVTATLNGSTVSTATTVTLNLGGSAMGSGTDYSATAPTITIAAEAATGMATFTITPTDDDVVEGDETIRVSGTAMGGFSGPVNSATVTLADNDVAPPAVTITAGTSPVTEGTAAEFTVTATTAPSSNLTVNVSVTDSGSFISGSAPTTVTIPMGSTTRPR